eukprot:scaffold3657_cov80-Phaeocystis_antarctica.AAC.5
MLAGLCSTHKHRSQAVLGPGGLSSGALEVAMPGAALALSGRVHPQERIHGLHDHPQLLPPRERRRCCREVAHAPQVLAVRRCKVEPRLQAAAHHQREDEARGRSVKAVAHSRSQPLCGDRTALACSDRRASPQRAAATGSPQATGAPRQGTPARSRRFQSGGPCQTRPSPAEARRAPAPSSPLRHPPTGPPLRLAPPPSRHCGQSKAPPTEHAQLRAPCPRLGAPQRVPQPP